ncbi:MAG: hypothetical protein IJ736_04705 [Firmicutes bacterium]|nr:hypothetical protein [Bacillota bacterium]
MKKILCKISVSLSAVFIAIMSASVLARAETAQLRPGKDITSIYTRYNTVDLYTGEEAETETIYADIDNDGENEEIRKVPKRDIDRLYYQSEGSASASIETEEDAESIFFGEKYIDMGTSSDSVSFYAKEGNIAKIYIKNSYVNPAFNDYYRTYRICAEGYKKTFMSVDYYNIADSDDITTEKIHCTDNDIHALTVNIEKDGWHRAYIEGQYFYGIDIIDPIIKKASDTPLLLGEKSTAYKQGELIGDNFISVGSTDTDEDGNIILPANSTSGIKFTTNDVFTLILSARPETNGNISTVKLESENKEFSSSFKIGGENDVECPEYNLPKGTYTISEASDSTSVLTEIRFVDSNNTLKTKSKIIDDYYFVDDETFYFIHPITEKKAAETKSINVYGYGKGEKILAQEIKKVYNYKCAYKQ